jgi:hypothetical protein
MAKKSQRKTYSIRVNDPAICGKNLYATIDVGEEKGLLITTCIHKKAVEKNVLKNPARPTKQDWRDFGITQRYILYKDNVMSVVNFHDGERINTLVPINEKGETELKSILGQGGYIDRKEDGEDWEYQVFDAPIINRGFDKIKEL